jgi:hypothetical protein
MTDKRNWQSQWSEQLTFTEVWQRTISLFPYAQIEKDNDGQWVIYTDCSERGGEGCGPNLDRCVTINGETSYCSEHYRLIMDDAP